MAQEHGGNLDAARAQYGGAPGDWIDLSTGINRIPYPARPPSEAAMRSLPTADLLANLLRSAAQRYGTRAPMVALAGAQAAIQLIPGLRPAGRARILGPTYNEHRASLAAAGWEAVEVATLEQLHGAEIAVVVNPNNPDGQHHSAHELSELAGQVGLLVVDESFADACPRQSLAPTAPQENVLILRSFGKFYGLAGLRLGFAIGPEMLVNRLAQAAGPWAISGPAIEAGTEALADRAWATETAERLAQDTARLDQIASRAGWAIVGGTPLFRLYQVEDAQAARHHLAQAHIWSRIFAANPGWIRLGLPGPKVEWDRVSRAFASFG